MPSALQPVSPLYLLERFEPGIVHLDNNRRVAGMNDFARRVLPVEKKLPFDKIVLDFHPERSRPKVAFMLDQAAQCPVAAPPPMTMTMIINIPERVLLIKALTSEQPCVLLIDEIDRADEAFLLEMLADYQITVPELGTLRARQVPQVLLTPICRRRCGPARACPMPPSTARWSTTRTAAARWPRAAPAAPRASSRSCGSTSRPLHGLHRRTSAGPVASWRTPEIKTPPIAQAMPAALSC